MERYDLMILGVIGNMLAIVYGTMSILAGLMQFKERSIPLTLVTGMILLGLMIMVSSIFIQAIPFMLFLLIISLFLMCILSIINGVHLYGKINSKHHIIRAFYSFVIVYLHMN